jgi:hypothetical protein
LSQAPKQWGQATMDQNMDLKPQTKMILSS